MASQNKNTVKCWGQNQYGQLGVVVTSSKKHNTPQLISDLSNVKALSLGNNHSCALLDDKKVKCWGYNNFSQIGIANTPQSNSVLKATQILPEN